MTSAVDSLALASRHANVDSPRRDLGVFLLTHEVELGRPDIGMPGKLAHLVERGAVADGVVDPLINGSMISPTFLCSPYSPCCWVCLTNAYHRSTAGQLTMFQNAFTYSARKFRYFR